MLRRNATTADVVACVSEPVVRWVRDRVPDRPDRAGSERRQRRPDQAAAPGPEPPRPLHGGVRRNVEALARGARPAARGCPRQRADRPGRPPLGSGSGGDGPGRADLERLAGSWRWTRTSPARCRRRTCRRSWPTATPPPPRTRRSPPARTITSRRSRSMSTWLPRCPSSRAPWARSRPSSRTAAPESSCPPGEPGPLADALIRLAEDPNLRKRLGDAARTDAVERYSWDGVLSHITAALPPARRLAVR